MSSHGFDIEKAKEALKAKREHNPQFKVGDLVQYEFDLVNLHLDTNWYGNKGIMILVREYLWSPGYPKWYCYSPLKKQEYTIYEKDLILLKRVS